MLSNERELQKVPEKQSEMGHKTTTVTEENSFFFLCKITLEMITPNTHNSSYQNALLT